MAKDISEFIEKTHEGAENFSRMHRSAEGMHDSIMKMAVGIESVKLAGDWLVQAVKKTETWQKVTYAISADNLNIAKLAERRIQAEKVFEHYQQNDKNLGTLNTRAYEKRLDLHNKEVSVLLKQYDFARKVADVGLIQLGIGATALGYAIKVSSMESQLNQDLIEANAAYSNRFKLLYSTLFTQISLGVSFDKAAHSAKALVFYAMDTEKSYSDNLRIVTQMDQGLAVSAQTSARLATIVERQLHGSFSKVADVVAQLVDDTALAGEEAASLGAGIATAMGRLRPGMGAAGLPDVLRLVGRYEGALKEVGGASGGFQQLLTRMTTTEGMGGAGALGVNPDFIGSAQGVQEVIDRFGRFGQRLVGMTNGWERQMRLEILGQMFGVSADQANQMLIAVQRANQETVGSIGLQERWRNQMNATDQGVSRLYNSLVGLVQGALYPFVYVFNAIVNFLANLVDRIVKFKPAAVTAMAVIGLGLLGVAINMARLGHELWKLVVTSEFAVMAQKRLAAAEAKATLAGAAGGILGGAGAAGGILRGLRSIFIGRFGIFSWIPKIAGGLPMLAAAFTGALALLTASLAAIAATIGLFYYKWKSFKENEKTKWLQDTKNYAWQAEYLDASRHNRLYRDAREGNLADAKHILAARIQDAWNRYKDEEPMRRTMDIRNWLVNESQLDARYLAMGLHDKNRFKTVAQINAESKFSKEALEDLIEATLNGNVLFEGMRTQLVKQRVDSQEQREKESIQHSQKEAGRARAAAGAPRLQMLY